MPKRKKQSIWRRVSVPVQSSGAVLFQNQPEWEKLPQLLSLRVTATLLDIHPNTLRLWDSSGKLKATRVGLRQDRRYVKSDVQELWQQIQPAPAEAYTKHWFEYRDYWAAFIRRWYRPAGVAMSFLVLLVAYSSLRGVDASQQSFNTLTISPQRCVGWQNGGLATTSSVSDQASLSDLNEKNSAHFDSRQYKVDSTSSLSFGSIDAPDEHITCNQFDLKKLTNLADVTSVSAVVELGTRAAGNTTAFMNLQTSIDGTTWTTVHIFPISSEAALKQVIDLPGIKADDLKKLQIRLAPDIEIDAPTVTADLDSIILKVTSIGAVASTKNIQAKQDLDKLVNFSKAAYTTSEKPLITVPKHDVQTFLFVPTKTVNWTIDHVTLTDHLGQQHEADYRTKDKQIGGGSSSTEVLIQTSSLHAGRYRLDVIMTSSDGATVTSTKNFLWGVVALNIRRPSPTVKQPETVSLGILDDNGRAICDAKVDATLTGPQGLKVRYFTAKNTIATNPDCIDKGVTNIADYQFTFIPTVAGTYHVAVHAITSVGTRDINENITVAPSVNFDIERENFPTRIYPPASYPVSFSITSNQDFRGVVTEQVPADFLLSAAFPEASIIVAATPQDVQRIEWPVDWKQGQTYQLHYTFKAPNISPALFRLGPLMIQKNSLADVDYQESRPWELASDTIVHKTKDDIQFTPVTETDADWKAVQPALISTDKPIYRSDEQVAVKAWTKGFAVDGAPGKVWTLTKLSVTSPNGPTGGFDQADDLLTKGKLERQVSYLVPNDHLYPGRYIVTATISDGKNTSTMSYGFDWGTLDIRTKSHDYKTERTIPFELYDTNDQGVPNCQSTMSLNLTQPDGKIETFSLAEGNMEIPLYCQDPHNRDRSFSVRYIPDQPGAYSLTVRRTADSSSPYVQDHFLVTERTAPSAKVKKEMHDAVHVSKASYKLDEVPQITLIAQESGSGVGAAPITRTIEAVTLINPTGKEKILDIVPQEQTTGATITDVYSVDPLLFGRPGKYSVVTTVVQDGVASQVTQDFTWGVLAVNLRRSIERPATATSVGLAVLDDFGRTLCNADVLLDVTDPSNHVAHLKTNDKTIEKNPNCVDKGVTNDFDYSAPYTTTIAGTYKLHVTANTDNGTRTIDDMFIVQAAVDFDIDRTVFSMRINPTANYDQRFTIVAHQDYQGPVTETVPASFELPAISDNGSQVTVNNRKIITWNVDWKANETHTLGYTIDFPDISPEYYKLGPLTIGNFAEARQWQVASDAACTASATGNWNAAATWGNTCNGGGVNGYPGATASGDTVTINANVTVTHTATLGFTIGSISFANPAATGANKLIINTTTSLTVTGDVGYVANTGTLNQTLQLNGTAVVNAGTLTMSGVPTSSGSALVDTATGTCTSCQLVVTGATALVNASTAVAGAAKITMTTGATNLFSTGSLTITSTTTGTGIAQVTTATGTITVGGATSCATVGAAAKTLINVTGAGTLNLGGNLSANCTVTLVATSTTNMTATSTISGAYTVGILNVNTGTTTLGAGTITVAGALTVAASQTLSLGNFAFTASSTTSVSGTISVAGVGSTGTYTFGAAITINSGGKMDLTTGTHAIATTGNITQSSSVAASLKFGTGNFVPTASFSFLGAGTGGIDVGSATFTIASAIVVTNGYTGGTLTFSGTTGISISAPTAANGLTLNDSTTTVVTNALAFASHTVATNAQTVTLGSSTGSESLTVGSLTMAAGTQTGNSLVSCATSNTGTLTVSTTIGITGNSTAAGKRSLTMGTCTLAVSGVTTLTGGTNATGIAEITATTGVLTFNNNLTFAGTAGNAKVNPTGAATINVNTGIVSGGNATASIVPNSAALTKFTGTSAVNTAYTSWSKWEIVSGTTTLGATQTTTGVQVDNGAILAGSTFLLTSTCNSTGTAGFTINGTYSGSGGVTLNTASCVIDGTGTVSNTGVITIGASMSVASTANITFGAAGGTNFFTVGSGFVLTNNGIVTLRNDTTTGGLAGLGTWTNALSGSVLNTYGVTTNAVNITTLTNTNGTVNYAGAAQTCKGSGGTQTYVTLKFTGSGTKTCTTTTFTVTNVEVGGTASWTMAAALSMSGTLTISGGTLITAGFAFTVSTTTSITSGTLQLDNNTGNKTLTGLVTVTTPGQLVGTSTTIILGSGITNTSGTVAFTASSLVSMNTASGALTATTGMTFINLTATALSQTFSGAGTITVSGTLTANTGSGTVISSSGTVNTATTTITSPAVVSNTGTWTTTTALGGTGNFTNGNGGTLNINFTGAPTISTLTASTNSNTVNYGFAGTQTCLVVTYWHLILSNSGVKTCNFTTVSGNFSMSGTASMTQGATATIAGTMIIGDASSAATYTTGNFTLGVTGSTTVAVASTMTHSGNAQLTQTGGLTVNGTLNGSGSGKIQVLTTVNGTGIVTMGTGTTFEQRIGAAANFGATSGVNTWTFATLTFSNSTASAFTATTVNNSSSAITVTNILNIGASGDVTGTTTLNAGDRTWTLSLVGAPLAILSSPQGILNGGTSTFIYSGDGTVTVGSTPTTSTYYNLKLNPALGAARAYTFGSGATAVGNNFDIMPPSGAFLLTVNVGTGGLTVTGTTTIQPTTATATLTTTASNYAFTTGALTISTGGTVTGNATTTVTVSGDVTINSGGTLTSTFGNLSVGGNFTFNSGGTFTHSSGTLTMFNTVAKSMNGTATSLSLYKLTVNVSGVSDATINGSYDVTVNNALNVGDGDFLRIATGRTLTAANTIAMNTTGTITSTGTGLFVIKDTSTSGPVGGTLSASTRFDATAANIPNTIFIGRTYGGSVEIYSNTGIGKSVSTVGSGTYTLSSTLTITTAGAAATTLDMDTTDPTTFTVTGAVTIGTTSILQATSSGTFNVAGSFTNSGTFTHNSGTLTMNGTGTLTSNGNTMNNFTTSGGGNITMATTTHTFAGNVNLGATTFTHGSSTIVMNGTSKTLDANGKSLYNLTISGTITAQNGDVIVANILNVSDTKTLTINSSYAVVLVADVASSTVNLNSAGASGGTIAGAGTLQYQNYLNTLTTAGTINSLVFFFLVDGNMTIPSRVFGSTVTLSQGTGAARTATFSAGTFTASALSVSTSGGAGSTLLLDASSSNNAFTLTNNFVVTAASGAVTLSMGSGTWTVGTNFDLTNVTTLNNNSGKLIMSGTGTLTTGLVSGFGSLFDLTITGTTTFANTSLYVLGNLDASAGTITPGTSTLFMNGPNKTLTMGSGTLYNLNIDPAGTSTVNTLGSNITISNVLSMGTNDTLNINTGQDITMSAITGGGINMGTNCTLTGGRIIYKTDTFFPGTGTINSSVRFDTTNSATLYLSGRTYGGAVEFYNSGASARTMSGTGAQDYTFSSTVTLTNSGAGSLSVDASIDNTMDVVGATSVGAGTTFFTTATSASFTGDVTIASGGTFSSSGPSTLYSNFTNNGNFTHNNQAVTFAGTSSINLDSGCVTVGSCSNQTFYDLIINKTDASTANDNVTLASHGITVAHTLTITDGELIQGTFNVRSQGTAAVSIAAAGTWTNISTGDLILGGTFVNAGTATFNSSNGTQCTNIADDIVITSTTATVQRAWSGAGTFVLYNVSATDMTGSVTAYSSTLSNTTWTVGNCGVTVSGVVYSDDGSTTMNCTTPKAVAAVVMGGTPVVGSCTGSGGSYTISNVVIASAGDVVAIYLSGVTEKANTVTLATNTSSNITADMYQNRLIVRHESAGPITNSATVGLGIWDKDNDAPNFFYTSNTNNLSLDSGKKLIVWTTKTYTPGGTVTTAAASNSGGTAPDGDLTIQATATLAMGANALSIGGDYTNSGSFTYSGTPTTTFTATTTGFLLTPGTGNFYDVTFNGASGGWAFQAAVILDHNLVMTAGTLSGTNNITVNGGGVTGNATITMTGGTFTVTGTGTFGGTTAWTFSSLNFGTGSSGTSTSSGAGGITVSSVLTIATSQTLNAGSKIWTLSGTTTPLSRSGTFTRSTSTVNYTSASGVTAISSATMTSTNAYYNLIVNGTGTFNATSAAAATNAVTVTAGTLSMGANALTIGITSVANSGSLFVASAGTYSSTGTTTINGSAFGTNCIGPAGCSGTAGTFTFGNLTLGDSVTTMSTSFGGTNPTMTVTGTLSIRGIDTFNAGSGTINLTSASGTPLDDGGAAGVFTASTSTVNYNGTTSANIFATTYYNLGLGRSADTSAATYTLQASTTVTNVLTVGNSSNTVPNADTLNGGGGPFDLILSGTGTPFDLQSGRGLFTANLSNVKYTGVGATNIAAVTYYDLSMLPVMGGSSFSYTGLGAITTTNSLNVTPSGAAQTLTFALGGTTDGSGTAISPTGSALALLDTTGSNYSFVAGFVTVGSNGSFNGRATTTITLASNLTINSGGTFTSTSGNLQIALNYTNSGTFTHSSGTVTLNGSAQQTISGTLTGTGAKFNNLTVTNASGSDPQSSASVIFNAALETAATLTDVTASSKLQFKSSATTTLQAFNFNGQAQGTLVTLYATAAGIQATFNVVGTGASRVINNIAFKDNNSCGSTGGGIDSSDWTSGKNRDDGNNSCWTNEKLTVTLNPLTSVALGVVDDTHVNQGSLTSTIITNGSNGFVSTVLFNQTLTSGANQIGASGVSGGTITQGDDEFGAATDDTTSVDLVTTSNSCVTGAGPYNATTLTTSPQVYASSSASTTGQVNTLCFLASRPVTKAPGSYTSTMTLVTTAKF